MTKWNWRDSEAATLHQLRRSAGLDPDGPRVPMQPYYTEAQQFNEMTAESRKHVRDASLVQALRFT